MRKLGCLSCGGSGITPEGEVCSCKQVKVDLVGLSYLPLELRNLEFLKEFCIREEIYNIYTEIKENLEFLKEVIIVQGEHGTSKIAFAYGLLNECYQKNLTVLPVLGISELRQIINGKYQYSSELEITLSDVTNVDFLCIKIDSIPDSYKLTDLINLISLRRNRLKGTLIITSIKSYDLQKIERGTKMFEKEVSNAKFYTLKR